MKSLKFHNNSPCTMICKGFQNYNLFLWKGLLYSKKQCSLQEFLIAALFNYVKE